MLEIMLDVNGWQGLFDFATGDNLDMENKPYLDMAKRISAKFPYPGDLSPDVLKWTTDLALEVCKEYDPQLFLLSYATPMIVRTHQKLSDEESKTIQRETLTEAFRFAKSAGYEPIIVSTGNLKNIDKTIILDDFAGYFSVSSDPYIGGIFGATENDFETVKNLTGLKYESRDEFITKYKITDQYALERTPDIILYAEDGYAFKNVGNRGLSIEMMSTKEKTAMVYSAIPGLPDDIFDFREFIDRQLATGKRIAVIVTEAIDDNEMPEGSKKINRFRNGINYCENTIFYYALLNAREFNEEGMPYIFHNPFIRKTARARYPYSYIKTDKYQNPIGLNREFKTASVGTRSGIFHSACMCDYSFECHCRGLAESGVLTFINSEKLGGEK